LTDVSKSLWVLLFIYGLLIAAAVLQSGGSRFGELKPVIRAESRASIYSLKEDVVLLRAEAKATPPAVRSLLRETCAQLRAAGAEISGEARVRRQKSSER
jgi:hypothetical protein